MNLKDELKIRFKSYDGNIIDAMIASYGDYGLTYSYAELFCPEFVFENGFPFIWGENGNLMSVDCFHIDHLHHNESQHNKPEFFREIGKKMAKCWTLHLRSQNFSGSFEYSEASGFDVIYRP